MKSASLSARSTASSSGASLTASNNRIGTTGPITDATTPRSASAGGRAAKRAWISASSQDGPSASPRAAPGTLAEWHSSSTNSGQPPARGTIRSTRKGGGAGGARAAKKEHEKGEGDG